MVAKSEIEKLKKEISKLKKITQKDPLTGLYNRRGFLEEAEKFIKMAQRMKQRTAAGSDDLFGNIGLIFVDLDNFKQINDRYGHNAGDQVLKKISLVLENSLRKFDIIGRWGGDEFVILVWGIDKTIILEIINRLKEKIGELTFLFKKQPNKITASLGAKILLNEEKLELEKEIEKSDKAMYQAKKKGKDTIVIL